jgi:hypothetical protein
MTSSVNERLAVFVSHAFHESLALLNSARFTLRRNLYLQGEHSAISIVVDERESERKVLVVCHVAGHLRMDWDGIGIRLHVLGSDDIFPAFLNAQGRAEFHLDKKYDAAQFQVQTSLSSAFMGTAGKVLAYAAAAYAEGHPEKETIKPFDYEVTSQDGKVVATAKQHPRGVVEIRVHTRENDLRGGVACIEFRSKSGKALQRQTILDLEDEHGFFGVWYGEISPSEDAAMYFVVFPPEGLKGK